MRNARATHLANLFLRAVEHLSIANDVCGNPVEPGFFMINTFFNGIFFQLCYSNCTTNNSIFIEKIVSDEKRGVSSCFIPFCLIIRLVNDISKRYFKLRL